MTGPEPRWSVADTRARSGVAHVFGITSARCGAKTPSNTRDVRRGDVVCRGCYAAAARKEYAL